ncbi:MAG: beta-lactamase family protein, partial [Anaerolineaceae bacterium]|nr:beta-lactamase family protein [Anaerolineaceae bacterium]
GDGCIVSTAEDLARFARMLLNKGVGPRGRILSETSYKKIVSPMIEEDGETYSYGLYLFDDEGYRHAGHGGDVPGYESYLWLDLDNGLGTVVLMTTPYTPRASFIALEFFREAYLGHRLPAPPPIPDFTHISDPQEYAGTYSSGQGELTFAADEHNLLLVCHDRKIILEEREHDRFYANHPDWDLHLLCFERAANGKVCEVSYGPLWFTNGTYRGSKAFEYPVEWDGYCGHFRSHNPWATNFRVFVRKGKLILSKPSGEEELLIPLDGSCFRIGEDEYIPEKIAFDQFIDGQALCAVYASCTYYRFFTP